MDPKPPPKKPTPTPPPAGAKPASVGALPVQKLGQPLGGSPPVRKTASGAAAMAALKDAKSKQKPEKGSQQPIEESVMAVLGLKDVKPAPLFLEFCDKILPRLVLPPTGRTILEAFSNIDVTADKLAACLKLNPYYEYQFLQVIRSLGKREDLPSLEAAVVLLGMQNSRNLILALQAIRMTKGTHPVWGEDGKLQLVPAEVLKYALKIEDFLSKDKGGYADTAYAAGFAFDLLTLLSADGETDPKISAAYIESVFSHGLKTAKIAAEIAKALPDVVLKKFVFSACLVHDIGKAAMTVLTGEYPKFVEECAKRGYPRQMRHFAETRKFGVNHAVLGSLICRSVGTFRPIEQAVFFHHEPHLVQANKGIFQLASLIALSSNIANQMKKPDGPEDPIFQAWKGLELSGFAIDPKIVVAALQKVSV